MFWKKKKHPKQPESLPDKASRLGRGKSLYILPCESETLKKILVLDMDETLVHKSTYPPHAAVELLDVSFDGIYVFKRPRVDEFLEKVTSLFRVYIYTAAEEAYAKPVLDRLCPMIPDDHRFYRDACNAKKGKCRKNLKMLSKKMNDIILVDDSSNAQRFYPHNNLQITRWNGTPVDVCLMGEVLPVLEMCAVADDVRTVIDGLPKKRQRRAFSEYVL